MRARALARSRARSDARPARAAPGQPGGNNQAPHLRHHDAGLVLDEGPHLPLDSLSIQVGPGGGGARLVAAVRRLARAGTRIHAPANRRNGTRAPPLSTSSPLCLYVCLSVCLSPTHAHAHTHERRRTRVPASPAPAHTRTHKRALPRPPPKHPHLKLSFANPGPAMTRHFTMDQSTWRACGTAAKCGGGRGGAASERSELED